MLPWIDNYYVLMLIHVKKNKTMNRTQTHHKTETLTVQKITLLEMTRLKKIKTRSKSYRTRQ